MGIEQAMKDFVQQILTAPVVQAYAYHNFDHALYVMAAASEIGKGVGLDTEQDQRLLQTAGLWHDTGFVLAYQGHEVKSCELVAQHLPGFGFSSAEIDRIQGMIMATRIPQNPQNLWEQVVADADLCYLGTSAAEAFASKLFLELQSLDPGFNQKQWNERQLAFLSTHCFWTPYAVAQFHAGKQAYMEKISQQVLQAP